MIRCAAGSRGVGMSHSKDLPLDLVPAGYFVWRSPLLPFDELEAWQEDLVAPQADSATLAAAVAADLQVLRSRLDTWLRRPTVREALFLASPHLLIGIDHWRKDPDSKRGRRAEQSLVRYFQRSATRPTPFGLFAGCSVGTIAEATRLRLAAQSSYRRTTRLDMDYLAPLCRHLSQTSHLASRLRFHPNTTLYPSPTHWRYVETRHDDFSRSHHLVAAERDDYLDPTLARAADGATAQELADALIDEDPDISPEDARAYIFELVGADMLVSPLEPSMTREDPLEDLTTQLAVAKAPSAMTEPLATTAQALDTLDSGGLGAPPEHYLEVARTLAALPTDVRLARLFQVDLIKPTLAASLAAPVVDEAIRGIDILHRLAGVVREDPLESFKTSFRHRYDECKIPLLEALDADLGIGFQPTPSPAPLLSGLSLTQPSRDPRISWSPRLKWIQRRLLETTRRGEHTLEVTDEDIATWPTDNLPPLPDALHVVASLAAPSATAAERGEFQLHLRMASGPSGSQMSGRFCHADDDLKNHLETHLRAEEALRPEAIFAEIVHLPEGRLGNVICRPRLRRYEIPLLGCPRGSSAHQIPLQDLDISLVGGEIKLWSRRLGQQVLPRLASAHNYASMGIGIYRFLCSLQGQGVRRGMGWQWGPFDDCAFLPRVSSGRLLLARARWRVEAKEIHALCSRDPGIGGMAARFAGVGPWRRRRNIPRRVVLADGDNELFVDFDNVLSVESFLSLAKSRPKVLLTECWPKPQELCAKGPEGRYFNELVIPFLRCRPVTQDVKPRVSPALIRRTFPPGSQWLYLKIFTGPGNVDRLLTDVIAPRIGAGISSGTLDRWFFLRYGDPTWHLRVRFHGPPRRLHREFLPLLLEHLGQEIECGRIWRFGIDTYEREVERYGGPAGIELAESLAHIDSEAVLEMISESRRDTSGELRWQAALAGTFRLLNDLGFEPQTQLEILDGLRRGFSQEFPTTPTLKHQLANRLRRHRALMEGLLADDLGRDDSPSERASATPSGASHEPAFNLDLLARRSRRLVPLAAALREHEAAGRLQRPLAMMAGSFTHLFINRLIPDQARAHERVIYDFLYQLLRSREARRRSQGQAAKAVEMASP